MWIRLELSSIQGNSTDWTKDYSTYSDVICGNETANPKASCTLERKKKNQTLMIVILINILEFKYAIFVLPALGSEEKGKERRAN